MKAMRKITILIGIGLLAMTMILPSYAASGRSPFELYAKQRRLVLPPIILYIDFLNRMFAHAMREEDLLGLFEELDIPVHGSDDGRYLQRAELIRGCSEECSPHDGFGQILIEFLTEKNTDGK